MKVVNSTLSVILAGVALVGCAMQTVIEPTRGQTEAQLNRDKAECLQVADKYYGVTNKDLTQSDSYVVCLKQKGYNVSSKF